MKMKYLENIGNFERYKHEPRIVKPKGLVKTPKLILKMYDMVKKGEDEDNPLKESKIFLEKEIKEKKIEPLTGLGFAILSKDMLNVCRWDSKFPILLKNQIYACLDDKINTWYKLDIEEEGPFCIWELGIVTHEKEAWKKYLESKKTDHDKVKYLINTIKGDL